MIIDVDVSFESQLNGKKIKEVQWPSHCLIVSIRRGDTEIIPKGDTKLMARDILYALVDEERIAMVRSSLLFLAGNLTSNDE